MGATLILYKLTCPQAEASRRVLERNKTLPKDSLVIDGHALKLFAGMFEPIEADENYVEITAADK